MQPVEQSLSGWGRFPRARCSLYRPERISEVPQIIGFGRNEKYIARGYGRSYGDASLNHDNGVVLMERMDRFLSFDPDTGILRCEAGVQLAEIIKYFLPQGWFLPVTPGTKFCSIGACVACDVHGKNHHKDGSLGNFVEEIRLFTPSGEVVRGSRKENVDLFLATIGGMGLTGIILEVTFRLRPVKSAYISVDYIRTKDLDETLASFEELDSQYTYSVGWLDCLARGPSFGRGLLMFGNHAEPGELSPLRTKKARLVTVPFDFPPGILNKYSLQIFNLLYYNMQKPRKKTLVDYDKFFYPLDKVLQWNRIYGKKGFLQYQCVVPRKSSVDALTRILEAIKKSGIFPFLAVLKRMGSSSGGILSFPMPGYTLALDFPFKNNVLDLLTTLDEIVLGVRGRVYLAKDARLSPESFKLMYPNLDRWQKIKAGVDPQDVFVSDLAKRVGL